MNILEEQIDELIDGQKKIIGLLTTAQQDRNDKVYDNSDIMILFHVSDRTLATWRTEGKISYSQVGAKFFYSQNNLDEFMAKHKVTTKLKNDDY